MRTKWLYTSVKYEHIEMNIRYIDSQKSVIFDYWSTFSMEISLMDYILAQKAP